jgi:hypothetical protein
MIVNLELEICIRPSVSCKNRKRHEHQVEGTGRLKYDFQCESQV